MGTKQINDTIYIVQSVISVTPIAKSNIGAAPIFTLTVALHYKNDIPVVFGRASHTVLQGTDTISSPPPEAALPQFSPL